MPPDETVRVKLSSEAAGSVSITPVVVRDMALTELLSEILAVAGKDERRVQDLLARGSLVSGASRFRWTGWQAEIETVREWLMRFPDPEPLRPFDRGHCVRATIQGAGRKLELSRDVAALKSFLRRESFWDHLLSAAEAGSLRYLDYSYRHRADCYSFEPDVAQAASLMEAGKLLHHSSLRDQFARMTIQSVHLFTERT